MMGAGLAFGCMLVWTAGCPCCGCRVIGICELGALCIIRCDFHGRQVRQHGSMTPGCTPSDVMHAPPD
eukprot:9709897-Alexandrium_andersonii.AAC.1